MSNTQITAATWFSSFNNFVYDPNAHLKSNFSRLATARKWGNKLRCARWVDCQISLFDTLYGTDTTKLEIWQDLCREVRIAEPPNSITGCKKILGSRKVLVNLVNLIEHRLTGVEVIRFPNYDAFWKYTSHGRKFPLEAAKSDGFIRALLRKL